MAHFYRSVECNSVLMFLKQHGTNTVFQFLNKNKFYYYKEGINFSFEPVNGKRVWHIGKAKYITELDKLDEGI